jgi:hypothetical protein
MKARGPEVVMQEAGPSTEPPKPPKVELAPTSLLWIAVIVGMCSGSEHHGRNETQKEIQQLREAVERIEKKVDTLGSAPSVSSAAPSAPASTGTAKRQ